MKIAKTIITLLCFLTVMLCASQNISQIYKATTKNENPLVGYHQVSVLILYDDNDFELFIQHFASRRMMKKNIILKIEKYNGTWNTDDENLSLYENSKLKIKFYRKGKKKLVATGLHNEIDGVNWKLVYDFASRN